MRPLLSLAVLATFTACGVKERTKKEYIETTDLKDYKNLTTAPSAIALAATAVVRVEDMAHGAIGTGSFIAAGGIFMTNHHVLGGDNCVREGCLVNLRLNYQIGATYDSTDLKPLFAVPLRISKQFDAAIYRMHHVKETDGKPGAGEVYQNPTHLTFKKQSVDELMNQEVHIIGHPLAELKKWKIAKVFGERNGYAELDKYVLGGNSGSPVLNAEGQVIGLLHSGNDGTKTVTKRGIQGQSWITSSADLLAILGEGGDLQQLAADDSVNLLDSLAKVIVEKYDYYLAVGYVPEGEKTPEQHADALASTCDSTLAIERTKQSSHQYMHAVATDCFIKPSKFFNCLSGDQPLVKTCPTGEKKTAWQERMQKALGVLKELDADLAAGLSIYPALLEKAQGAKSAAKTNFDLVVGGGDTIPLSLPIAAIKIQMSEGITELTYNGQSVYDFMLNYKQVPYFERNYKSIVLGHIFLHKQFDLVPLRVVMAVLNEGLNSDSITLEDYLSVEAEAFEEGLL